MTTALQNRLVGTIILVALAVIFLPDFLDGKKESNQDLFVDLPAQPKAKSVADATQLDESQVKEKAVREIEIVTDEPVDDLPPDVPSEGEANTATNSLAEDTTISTESDNPQERAGWVVQLGVFRHDKNVRELLSKLQNAGYRAFSRPVKTQSGELTKVFVGPDLQKEKLEESIPHLLALTNLKGRITPFTVK